MALDPQELGQSHSDLATILQELRKRAGLSGVQLARRVNMSQSKISKIETGKVTPSLVDVELILRALRASASRSSDAGCARPGVPAVEGPGAADQAA
ncbi:helix-turn-helix transcriptional regulator, partial [Kitasatospora sp. NPDC096077]|uniref:helix-turn-helix domain-containing protein n=1 Tax=Kitasatospora sp. NPDC096077 TaxID=3155544 RepID=UPI003328AF69